MAGRYEFDITVPHPNVDIDALRRYIADNLITLGDVQLLLAGLQAMSDFYLQAVADSLADRAALAERVAYLEDTVAALQAAPSSPIADPAGSEPAP